MEPANESLEQSAEVVRLQQMVANMSSELDHLKQQVVVRQSADDCHEADEVASTGDSAAQYMRCRECHCMVDLNFLEDHGLVCYTAGEEPGV